MTKALIQNKEKLNEVLGKFEKDKTNLLPILLEVQKTSPSNYISEAVANYIAEHLDITVSKVAAAISFFSALSDQPRGKNIIRICKSTACMVNGHKDLLSILEGILDISVGETTEDNVFTLEQTECIGACDISPAFKVNDQVYGNLTEGKIIEVLNTYREDDERFHKKIISKNFKKYNPESLTEYKALGGFEAFKKALGKSHEEIINIIDESGLRGRGGAGYPTGRKLKQAKAPKNDRKIIICNADEGEPGTFKDRQFVEHDPFKIIEGMLITGYVVDGTEGYIYIRHEYNHLHRRLRNVIHRARKAGLLGENILGSDFSFDIKVFSGGGAYICGEGGALIESMEGKIGYPRVKPPYTKQCGLHQLPTLVINVETLCSIATILDIDEQHYAQLGTKASPGTKLISMSGNINRPGAYEVEFGISINDIINHLGHGIKSGLESKFIQLGGASGPLVPKEDFETKLCYDALGSKGYAIGSGAIVVCDENQKVTEYLQNVYEFFEHESCGKCTPCREGHHLIVKHLNRINTGLGTIKDIDNIKRLAEHMADSSFCGLGKTAPSPLLSAFKHFEDEIYLEVNGQEG